MATHDSAPFHGPMSRAHHLDDGPREMTDTDRQRIWETAIDQCEDLSLRVRNVARSTDTIEEHCFDQSYLEFLDTQIRLSPRGPEWTERLKTWRTNLAPWCDQTLMYSSVRVGNDDYTIEVLPGHAKVIHWERYEDMAIGPTSASS